MRDPVEGTEQNHRISPDWLSRQLRWIQLGQRNWGAKQPLSKLFGEALDWIFADVIVGHRLT